MKKLCPLFKEPCKEHQCAWYIRLLGTNPQTDHPIDEYGCAMGWMPILLIENSKEVRQGAAAVESARNEQVRTAAVLAGGLAALYQASEKKPFWSINGHVVVDQRVQKCDELANRPFPPLEDKSQ